MKYLITIIFSSCVSVCVAQDYSVLTIPDSLTENANAVNRYYELRINIISENKLVTYEKRAITILNEAGSDFADYTSSYDQQNTISYLNGNLYDAFGKKIKEVKKKDIQDHPAYDGISLMRDDRYKKHNFYCRSYPYTAEYEEEDEQNQSFYLPAFSPQLSHLMSVQYSKLVVTAPENFKFRYKEMNIVSLPAVTKNKGQVTYTWVLSNIKAKKSEPYQPAWQQIFPAIYIAPSSFAIGDYRGNMDSWENYGKFINDLRKDRDVLPTEIKATVHRLTDNVNDDREKVNILYNYLQQNSRYISVQLGIGGFQPFDAAYVAANKYGDCKALSNYMVALLNEAGVKADYVLIAAGENANALITDFPMTQFNHATVCVPMSKDSVWLECTDQMEAPGFAGYFTGNRKAVLIDEQGGHVVRTPVYTEKDNIISRKITGSIDSVGNLKAGVQTFYKGCSSVKVHNINSYLSPEEKDKRLKSEFDLPTYSIAAYTFKEQKKSVPSVNEELNVTADKYATISGKRIFISPVILTRSNILLDTSEDRLYDVVIKNAFTYADTIELTVPADYHAEALPKTVQLETKFGCYKNSFGLNGNKLVYTRWFMQPAGTYSISDYRQFAWFINSVYKADRGKIVLAKN